MTKVRQIILETAKKLGVSDEFANSIQIEYSNTKSWYGLACYKGGKYIMKLSVPLLSVSTKKKIVNTIVHEFCHLVDKYFNGRMSHGWKWQSLMIKAGYPNPQRCGESIRNKDVPGMITVYCYCGSLLITKNKATRMNKGQKYVCNRCRTVITFKKEEYNVQR